MPQKKTAPKVRAKRSSSKPIKLGTPKIAPPLAASFSRSTAAIAPPWQPKRRGLMLRTCNVHLQGWGGFQWPGEGGHVTAPDWKPRKECGNGLHGLLWGEGGAAYLSTASNAKWMVCEIDLDEVVEIDRKIKVPQARVLHVGDKLSAIAFLQADPGSAGKALVFGTATAGDRGTATAGYGGTATAGYGGMATAGEGGTATAGYGGAATAGYGGTIAIRYYDPKRRKYRMAVAEVGENGIEAKTAYVVDDAGALQKAPKKGGA